MKIYSKYIQMFPSSKREPQHDRNSRLPTESNLASMVDRLTIPCFIINGLDVADNIINVGNFNMGGVLFCLLDKLTIDVSPIAPNKYLCFVAKAKKSTVDVGKGFDYMNITDDSAIRETSYIGGLSLEVTTELISGESLKKESDTDCTFYLPVAEVKEGKWVSLYNKDGMSGNVVTTNHRVDNRWSKSKFRSEDIQIDYKSQSNNYVRNEPSDKRFSSKDITEHNQDLNTYLNYNLVIDGGEVL